mgnify:CR=1 FL=1
MKKNNYADHPLLFKIIMFASGLIAGFICIKIFFLLMDVKTNSMNPALKSGDKIIIGRMSKIKKGDIVAFHSPAEEGKILLSRIIAAEYDTVEVRNKIVYINDKNMETNYKTLRDDNAVFPLKFCFRDNMPPVKLARNEFFVLGDNFDKSFDSRNFGRITKNSVIGKVIYNR